MYRLLSCKVLFYTSLIWLVLQFIPTRIFTEGHIVLYLFFLNRSSFFFFRRSLEKEKLTKFIIHHSTGEQEEEE
jgi:hypothetical protein